MQACSNSKSLKAGETMKASEILEQIEQGAHIFYKDVTVEGDFDLTSLECTYQESELVKRVDIQGSVTFISCRFTGGIKGFSLQDKSMISCSFQRNFSLIDCAIEGEVDLREASYIGNVQFKKTAFKKSVRMEGNYFQSNAIFNNCIFLGDASFHNSYFNWKSNFMESEFAKNCGFQGAIFNGQSQFSSIRCSAYADFTLLDFRQGAMFSYANFDDRVNFGGTKFRDRVDFVKTEFTTADFGNVLFQGEARFNSIAIYSKLILEASIFYGAIPKFTFKEEGMGDKLSKKDVRVVLFERIE